MRDAEYLITLVYTFMIFAYITVIESIFKKFKIMAIGNKNIDIKKVRPHYAARMVFGDIIILLVPIMNKLMVILIGIMLIFGYNDITPNIISITDVLFTSALTFISYHSLTYGMKFLFNDLSNTPNQFMTNGEIITVCILIFGLLVVLIDIYYMLYKLVIAFYSL